MRLTLLKMTFVIGLIAIFSTQIAFATTSPSFSCSSSLVVSFDNGYSASCDGDFSFTEGLLQNDTSINLTASGLINIGANASLNAPLISLNSKDIFLDGVLNAPGGNIYLSSTNSTTITRIAQIDVVGNSVIQKAPKAIVDWKPLNITPAIDGLDITTFGTGTIDAGRGSKTITLFPSKVATQSGGDITIVSTIGAAAGSGIRVDNYDTEKGGTIIAIGDIKDGKLITTFGVAAIDNSGFTVHAAQVPEPSTYMMMLLGLISLVFIRKTKKY